MLCKNANAFKNVSSELAGNAVKKLPVTPNKFNNCSTEQYNTNAKKNHPNFKLSSATLETTKKNLSCLDASYVPGSDGILSNSLKEVQLWHRSAVVNTTVLTTVVNSALKFYAGSNPTLGVSEIYDAENV